MFTRDELIDYINNCVTVGKVVTKHDILVGDIIMEPSDNTFKSLKSTIDALEFSLEREASIRNSLIGAVEYSGFYFKIDSQENIILVYSKSTYRDIDLGNCVDIIGSFAFSANLGIKSIKGISVKKLDYGAFAYSTVYSVDFPNLEEIGAVAFVGCSLGSLIFDKVNIIFDAAFSGTSVKRLCFKSPILINAPAFNNSNIDELILPNNIAICGLGIGPLAGSKRIGKIIYFNPTNDRIKLYLWMQQDDRKLIVASKNTRVLFQFLRDRKLHRHFNNKQK